MINKISTLLLSGVFMASACTSSAQPGVQGKLKPEPQYEQTTEILTRFLENEAYRTLAIDDRTSENLFKEYLKNIDYGKMYFTKPEVDEFAKEKLNLDDKLKAKNVDFAYNVYNAFLSNADQMLVYVDGLLKDSMDFSKKEFYDVNPDKYDYAKDVTELKDRWRKRIKFEALGMLTAGKSWKGASEELKKRYTNYHNQLKKTKSQDVYDVYMSTLCNMADPHTDYFSPRAAADFTINSSLSLEGIGATLQMENEYTKIHEIVKGGPADKSGKVFVNDRIIAVAQGTDGEYEDVIGWRIDDVVSKIRGPKGTFVKLKIIDHKASPSDPPKEVVIQREKIKLEEQAAKANLERVKRGDKEYAIGVIKLPSFYMDYDGMRKKDPDYKSTTRDLRKLIDSLKTQGMQGLILDLRNNGGGALQEAIDATGLFIDKGPVVQIKDMQDKRVEHDRAAGRAWDGKLIILVNRFSASASEILAAALQDYGRAVIVGERTHGKGTVQNVINLDEMGFGEEGVKKGEVKITIAKFYRVSGGSTQVNGVMPDIRFVSVFDDKAYGEDESPYHLPYDEIAAAPYLKDTSGRFELARLLNAHNARMKGNAAYDFLKEDIEIYYQNKNKEKVALQFDAFKKENEKNQQRKADREKEKEKLKNAGKPVPDDLIYREGLQIMMDMIG